MLWSVSHFFFITCCTDLEEESSDNLDDEAFSSDGSEAGEDWETMDKRAGADDKRKRFDGGEEQPASRKRSRRR